MRCVAMPVHVEKLSGVACIIILAACLSLSSCAAGGSRGLAEPLSPAEAAESGEQPVRLLSWNLEHFVDHFDDPYVHDPREDAGAAKPDAVLRLMARAIWKMDADVMAFQEIESDRAAKLFLDSYLPDHEYKYFACVPAMDWYQNVVVASRFPLGPMVSFREIEMENPIADFTTNMFNNRLLAVEVRPREDYSFYLVNVHLKAGQGEEDVLWRKMQIDVFRNFLDRKSALDPQRHAVVMGDMNFTPGTPEYDYMLTGGTVAFHDPFAKWGNPPSHSTTGPSRQIDHIFFNEPMYGRYISGTTAVAKPLSIDQISTITDHLPVVASFLPPQPEE